MAYRVVTEPVAVPQVQCALPAMERVVPAGWFMTEKVMPPVGVCEKRIVGKVRRLVGRLLRVRKLHPAPGPIGVKIELAAAIPNLRSRLQ